MAPDPADRTDPFALVGRTLGGKYQVECVVQETGMSVVYRAAHRVWRRPVAVKAFKAQAFDDDARRRMLESFVREGALLADLSELTAGVCQARDVGSMVTPRGEWVPYLVLEWLDGEPLDVVLEREQDEGTPPRTVERALQLLAPVASALSLAHDRGIVHRDVKPGNICLLADADARGKPLTKLYDFGLATSLRGVSGPECADDPLRYSYTPGYAAPEQYSPDHGTLGPWTDVFALALVFIELVTGQEALSGDTVDELRLRACDPSSRPTPRTHGVRVGDAMERVLAQALAVRPERRYGDARDFWAALTRAAKERAREATIPIWLVKPRPKARKSWMVPALAVGSGAVTFALLSHWAQLSHALGFIR
jgi:eukaryotic-like serine/threonine-protein kinase